MGTREEEREQARKLGRQINHDARSNVDSPYAGIACTAPGFPLSRE
jgi:hypothetical protein